jgi:hypothetical protein
MPHLDEVVAAAEADLIPLMPDDPEPTHGSIVLISSTTGTAAQRFYSDGLWHVATGEVIDTYANLFIRSDGRPRDVFVAWVAPEWEGHRPRYVGPMEGGE